MQNNSGSKAAATVLLVLVAVALIWAAAAGDYSAGAVIGLFVGAGIAILIIERISAWIMNRGKEDKPVTAKSVTTAALIYLVLFIFILLI